MRVIAVHDVPSDTFKVYVELGVQEDGSRIFESTMTNYGDRIQSVSLGQEPPLYCAPIPTEVGRAIAEALAPRPVATERHLDDAIAVRDRMLKLVEGLVTSGVAP